jgi:hypothetical protein
LGVTMKRLIFAFIIAPAFLPAVIAAAFAIRTGPAGANFGLLVAALGYGVAIVAGIPLVFLLVRKRLLGLPIFLLAGVALGVVVALVYSLSRDAVAPPSLLLSVVLNVSAITVPFTVVAALLFWFIGIRNNAALSK